MARRVVVSVALLVLCALQTTTLAAPVIKSKCTACQCITTELRQRMQSEKPRNHLDMRHRLDEHGKRYGKVIDYKNSELRAVELLDGICDKMSNYILASFVISRSGKKTEQWAQFSGGSTTAMINSTRYPHHEEAALQKQLSLYCGAVMEEWEEDLEGAITSGKFDDLDTIDEYLCRDKVKACPDGTVPREWINEPLPPKAEGEASQGDTSGASNAEAVAPESASPTAEPVAGSRATETADPPRSADDQKQEL